MKLRKATIDTVDKEGNPMRTSMELNGDVLIIKEGMIRSDYTEGVSWHHELVFSGVKLNRLKDIINQEDL